MTTTGTPSVLDDATIQPLVERYVSWIETGICPDGLFAEDLFCDFTPPQWRLQTQGRDATLELRRRAHPTIARVPRFRVDATGDGFVIEWEEEWADDSDQWYCREMARATVVDGLIAEISVYCTGDWSSDHKARHAHEVPLIRP